MSENAALSPATHAFLGKPLYVIITSSPAAIARSAA